jgi:hypothetical protein
LRRMPIAHFLALEHRTKAVSRFSENPMQLLEATQHF